MAAPEIFSALGLTLEGHVDMLPEFLGWILQQQKKKKNTQKMLSSFEPSMGSHSAVKASFFHRLSKGRGESEGCVFEWSGGVINITQNSLDSFISVMYTCEGFSSKKDWKPFQKSSFFPFASRVSKTGCWVVQEWRYSGPHHATPYWPWTWKTWNTLITKEDPKTKFLAMAQLQHTTHEHCDL